MSNDKVVVCFVVRHGATQLNQSGCFRGNLNPPLAPEGRKDAEHIAHLFSTIDISHIFCSDKTRAVETAETIAREKGVPIHKSESLRALNVGDFSGQKRTPESEAALQVYLDDPDCCIPGGESLNDFKARIQPCFQEAIDVFMECGVPPLIVAHSSVIHELGSTLYQDHKSILVDPGGAVAMYFSDGKLGAEPIFKPARVQPGNRADTVS
jgi:broad specificity phosphatase PhoE